MRLRVALLLLLLGACAETRRTIGEDCLKNDDCQSAFCSSQKCTAAPPILDATVIPPVPDADVQDGMSDGPSDAPPDTRVPVDASTDVAEAG